MSYSVAPPSASPLASAPACRSRESRASGALAETARRLWAPLTIQLIQRVAIGGLVGAVGVRARASGVADASIGASFAVFLAAFAAVVVLYRRSESKRPSSDVIPLGGLVFAGALMFLAVASGRAVMPLLALAGLGAGVVHAACLSIVSSASDPRRHASTMAFVHAAGAICMIAGPLANAALDLALPDVSPSGRSALFLILAGGLHALSGVALHADCRAVERSRKH